MTDNIFVSYSHKDSKIVRDVVTAIESSSNKSVWYDASLRGGENYFSVIANQILKCKYFVFVVSANSVCSDWCLRELEFAASENKIIVAIWIENVEITPRVKLIISNTHYIHYYSLSGEMFCYALKTAFSGTQNESQIPQAASNGSRETSWGQRYFLEADKLSKIADLLNLEKSRKYSECFLPENAVILGIAYELGIKTDVNLTKAGFYYKISAHHNNYDGKYLYAALCLQKKDAEIDAAKCLKDMIDAAENGSVFALTYLGDEYYYGRNGCCRDRGKAYELWKKAVELGSVTAMYYMAYAYRHGECVEQDFELACMYALRAAEYDFPRAYRILAFMYENGEFFEKDYDKAIEMYDEAIKRGDCLSLCYEGWVYGEKKEHAKMVELYTKAYKMAEEGKTESGLPYYRMGIIYEYGKGVPKNYKKAVEFYLQAASRKYSNALTYTVSTIMKLDKELQEEYLLRALEMGCEDAAYELGVIEKRRNDSERLSDNARKYFIKGSETGDIQCTWELLTDYSFVIGKGETSEDRMAAIKYFQSFFANINDDYLANMRKNNNLTTFYYAYAIELDFDPDNNTPDREFVQMYFKKSLDECPVHLARIIGFVVGGYLFPKESGSGLDVDVLHTEETLSLAVGYLDSFRKYLLETSVTNLEEAASIWSETIENLKKGYLKISDCYRLGQHVRKNRKNQKRYKLMADQISLYSDINTPLNLN